MKLISRLKAKILFFIDIILAPFRTQVNLKSIKYKQIESNILSYTVPNILFTESGILISDVKTWQSIRRPEIFSMLSQFMYGKSPLHLINTYWQLYSVKKNSLKGYALRKEIDIRRKDKPDAFFRLIIYYPKKRAFCHKTPVFLGLNFYGNHTITKEDDISITDSWIPANSITHGRKADCLRGVDASAWPIIYLLENGFAVATAYYGDIVPDRKDGKEIALRKWFTSAEIKNIKLESWGAIDAWAWALIRAIDYICQDEDLDKTRVALFGHSRLGKVALWAGAQDERFSIVISNNSGCCGASLSKRRFGETIEQLNTSQPHWFNDKFKLFNNKEDALPFDQHFLIAMIAPRPVYIASAQLDLHADPYGEFLAAKFASSVYELFGLPGLPVKNLPEANRPVMGTIGYHIRKGYHGIKYFDWQQFIKFADMHFNR